MITVAIAAVAAVVISVPVKWTLAQTPAASGQALNTPWGEPDLQRNWADVPYTQRPAKYAHQEFITAI